MMCHATPLNDAGDLSLKLINVDDLELHFWVASFEDGQHAAILSYASDQGQMHARIVVSMILSDAIEACFNSYAETAENIALRGVQ